MNYHSIDDCEKTRHIDDILDGYELVRRKVTRMMSEDPDRLSQSLWKKNDSPIPIDDECRSIGDPEYGNNRFYRSIFSCSQCKNVERLLSNEDEIIIECG